MPIDETVPPSPASEEMPEWVESAILGAREDTFVSKNVSDVIVYLADRVDALTRELSESRARAVQGEQDSESAIQRAYIAGYLEAEESRDSYERVRARAEGFANHYVNARRRAALSTPGDAKP